MRSNWELWMAKQKLEFEKREEGEGKTQNGKERENKLNKHVREQKQTREKKS
jgi:hypothetical protein